MEKRTQTSEILRYMREHGSITQAEATECSGNRKLSSIIDNLRNDGYVIETVSHTGKNRFGNRSSWGEYVLHAEPGDEREQKVLKFLKERGCITNEEAWAYFDFYKLLPIINKLRKKGYKIGRRVNEDNETEYYLKGEMNV